MCKTDSEKILHKNNQIQDKVMNMKTEKYSVGVIVARFQVPALHEAHIELINSVLEKHAKVLILLGLAPTKGTVKNPLDYQPRRQMILEAFPPQKYPNVSVGYIKDIKDDLKWSKTLDNLILDEIQPNDTVCLYGGRDSFIKSYKGRFPTCELVSDRFVSGSEIRAQVAAAPQAHPFFRAGAIWATHQRYPTVYPTVDVIPYHPRDKKILLIKKPNETLYRFPGGFASPEDESYEVAAVRELKEETKLDALESNLIYLGSARVKDWRYENEVDKIITHVYFAKNVEGDVEAGDDASEARWFPAATFSDLTNIRTSLVEEHVDLFNKFLDKVQIIINKETTDHVDSLNTEI